MTIISLSTFNASQPKYFDLARKGERVVVKTDEDVDFEIILKKPAKRKKTAEEKLYDDFREAVREMKAHQRGEIELQTWEEFYDELQSNPR